MAQLVELSLPIPEVSSSHPVIGKIYIEPFFTFSNGSVCDYNHVAHVRILTEYITYAHLFRERVSLFIPHCHRNGVYYGYQWS